MMKISFTSTLKRGCLIVGSAVVASLMFASCSKDVQADSTPVAGVMVFNMSTAYDKIGIAFSGNDLGASIPYSGYVPTYWAVPEGQRIVAPYNANTGSVIVENPYTFEAGKYYSSILTGANGNNRNIVINDNLESLSPISGDAFVRFVNAIPDSAKPTITIKPDNDVAQTITNLGFGSVTEFREMPVADSITISISNGSTIQASTRVQFNAAFVYTIGLLGDPTSAASDKKVGIGLYPMADISR